MALKFDDPLLESMLQFTVEDLLYVSIYLLGELSKIEITKETIDTCTVHLTKLFLYLTELYRRNAFQIPNLDFITEYQEFIKCPKTYSFGTDHFRMFSRIRNTALSMKPAIVQEYNMVHSIKRTMLSILKKPVMVKDIRDKMECILDTHGNQVCVFKEFLSPEHYERIRSGCDISEWTLESQEELLHCLDKIS